MVDNKFRENLDSFYDRMEKRSKAISSLETITMPKIMVEKAREVFPETIHILNILAFSKQRLLN